MVMISRLFSKAVCCKRFLNYVETCQQPRWLWLDADTTSRGTVPHLHFLNFAQQAHKELLRPSDWWSSKQRLYVMLACTIHQGWWVTLSQTFQVTLAREILYWEDVPPFFWQSQIHATLTWALLGWSDSWKVHLSFVKPDPFLLKMESSLWYI